MEEFKKRLQYYGKDALIHLLYFLTADLLGAFILYAIRGGNVDGIVGGLLALINLFFYGFILAHVYFKTGEEAMKLRHGNDLERRHMLETKQVVPIERVGEYRSSSVWWILLWAEMPVLLSVFASLIVMAFGGAYNVVLGLSTGLYYTAFYGFFGSVSPWLSLTGLLITGGAALYGYLKGVNKIAATYRQAEKIKEKLGDNK